MDNRYAFIIDTDSYAGNFERELCAYITGQVGECEVGDDYVEDVEVIQAEMPEFAGVEMTLQWIEHHILQQDDEGDHCLRPCAIWPTKGRTNDGNGVHSTVTETNRKQYDAYESVAIFFDELPPPSVLDFMQARAKTFVVRPLFEGHEPKTPKVENFRLEFQRIHGENMEIAS